MSSTGGDGAPPVGPGTGPPKSASGRGRRRTSRKETPGFRRAGRLLGTITLAIAIGGAPLAAGTVHRPTVIAVFVLILLALGTLVTIETVAGVPLRMSSIGLAATGVFLLIPLLQSIPLPTSVVNRLDPASAELTVGAIVTGFRPLSMDPPATWLAIGQAAATMAVVIVSAHLISGTSMRYLLLRTVVISAVLAVVIGLGHRILGESRIFGVFPGSRGVLNGPFINPNHTAEFLELAFFAALALAFAKRDAVNRIGWLAAAIFVLAGALGTLSRGGVLAIAIASTLFAALYQRTQNEQPDGAARARWLTPVLAGSIGVILSLTLGASQLLAKFSASSLNQETRLRLWIDSLKLLVAHPLGIGRGAFERVYPTVRTVEGDIPVRFSFVENEPLQMLIDTGWLGMSAIVFLAILLARDIWKRRRGDRIELALVCGLVAVLVHGFVDFGLETLGLLLPFAVVLGAVMGRTKNWSSQSLPRSRAIGVALGVGGGLVVAAAAIAQPTSRDFDALVHQARTLPERRAAAVLGESAHPFDYYYTLMRADTEPLRRTGESRSPRLAALNRALLLCPNCPDVHSEIARSLWAVGKRQQALAEWRSAIRIRPSVLNAVLVEAIRAGVRPDEFVVLSGGDSSIIVLVSRLYLGRSEVAAARKVLNAIPSEAGQHPDVLLLRAELDFRDGKDDLAVAALDVVDRVAPRQARSFLLRAELARRAGNVDAALDVLDRGVALSPLDIPLQERRLQLIVEGQKWSRAEAASDGLEMALFHAGLPTTVVHTSRARLAAARGEAKTALAEYHAAINQNGRDAGPWMDLGAYLESLGRYDEALAALREAEERLPSSRELAAAIARVKARKARSEDAVRSNLFMVR